MEIQIDSNQYQIEPRPDRPAWGALLRPWLPWASADPLEPALLGFIRQSVARFRRGEDFGYAIWDDATSLIVGGAGLHPRLGPDRIEIGYWVRKG